MSVTGRSPVHPDEAHPRHRLRAGDAVGVGARPTTVALEGGHAAAGVLPVVRRGAVLELEAAGHQGDLDVPYAVGVVLREPHLAGVDLAALAVARQVVLVALPLDGQLAGRGPRDPAAVRQPPPAGEHVPPDPVDLSRPEDVVGPHEAAVHREHRMTRAVVGEPVVRDGAGRWRGRLVAVLGRGRVEGLAGRRAERGGSTHCRENIWHRLCQALDPVRCCCWANSLAWA